MLIDWFTVVAQLANFLILVALLKRFLWKRLVQAIDQRENRIAGRQAETDQKSQEASRLLDEMRVQKADLEHQRSEMMAQAQREAEDRRNEMIRQAREEVQGLESRWRDDLAHEQADFLDELRRRTAAEMVAVMRRALADLACADIEHCAFEVFLEKLQTIDTGTLRDLASREMTVLSATELPGESRLKIQSVLEERLGAAVHPQFRRMPAIAWGIELRSDGRRIGWTPDSYLEALENKLREALKQRTKLTAEGAR